MVSSWVLRERAREVSCSMACMDWRPWMSWRMRTRQDMVQPGRSRFLDLRLALIWDSGGWERSMSLSDRVGHSRRDSKDSQGSVSPRELVVAGQRSMRSQSA